MNLSRRFLLPLLLIILLSPVFPYTPATLAQDTNGGWGEPTNVSRSGGAVDPLIVVDSSGVTHLLWKDTYSGYQYSKNSEEGWTTPQDVQLPFATDVVNPTIRIDSEDVIHAFWIDGRQRLQYSVTTSRNMGSSSWSGPTALGSSVSFYKVAQDDDNQFHVAYIQSADLNDNPAGIYNLMVSAFDRTRTTLIFPSPYFRKDPEVSQAELIEPALDITATSNNEGTGVYILWGQQETRRISYTYSTNAEEWEPIVEIETPDSMPGDAFPQSVKIINTSNQQTVALWQVSHKDGSCSAYYRVGDASRVKWTERQPIFADNSGCLENIQAFNTTGGKTLLFTQINQLVNLALWDGTSWTAPQPQNALSGFTDPNTRNIVDMGCFQPFIKDDQIFISGCDQGIGGDIWILSGAIDDILQVEEETLVWSSPKVINASASRYFSPSLLASTEGLHAFWSQPNDLTMPDVGVEIFHSVFTADGEASTFGVLQSPTGRADPLTITIDREDRLLAVWNGGTSGEVYFSQAPVAFSQSPADWSSPVRVRPEIAQAYQPQIASAPQGQLFIAYLTPVNENRGVYITRSDDLGQTWSEPIQVFQATAEDCEMVDQLQLSITGSGFIHVSWVCQTQPGGTGAIALWAAQSADLGVTWSPAAVVSFERVLWSRLIATEGDLVHLLWKEFSNGRTHLWHAMIHDSETVWQGPQEIASPEGISDTTAVAIDAAQQIYLVHITGEFNQETIRYWWWDGNNWNSGPNAQIQGERITNTGALSATITPDGLLSILFTGMPDLASTGQNHPLLYFAAHPVVIPVDPVVIVVTTQAQQVQATASPQETPVPTIEILPTATVDLSQIKDTEPAASGLYSYRGLAIGAVLVILLIATVFFIQYRSKFAR